MIQALIGMIGDRVQLAELQLRRVGARAFLALAGKWFGFVIWLQEHEAALFVFGLAAGMALWTPWCVAVPAGWEMLSEDFAFARQIHSWGIWHYLAGGLF